MSSFRHVVIAAALSLTAGVATAADASKQHNKDGFTTFVEDGRLWVFKNGSTELEDFKKHGEPAKMATKIGAGPAGMTVKSADIDTVEAYLAAP